MATIREIQGGRQLEPAQIDHLLGLYDSEIAFVDQEIGRLLLALDALGLEQETLIVIVGDHGESFGELRRWLHGQDLFGPEIHVPLIVRYRPVVRAGTRVDEVAQSVAPESRIVYVDYDPLVLVHARALLTSGPEGATDYIDADIRDVEKIHTEAARTIDLGKPVAVILSGILAHLPSAEEARAVAQRIMAGLASGSYLVVCDGTNTNPELNEVMKIWNDGSPNPVQQSGMPMNRSTPRSYTLPPAT